MLFLVRDSNLGSLWSTLQVIRYQPDDKLVWNKSDGSADRDRQGAENDRVKPLSTIEMYDIEGLASNKYNHDLTPDHDAVNRYEEPVPRDTFKYVEFVIKAAVTRIWLALITSARRRKSFYSLPLIEDLHPDKSVEDKGGNLTLLVGRLVGEYRLGSIVEQKCNGELI